MKLTITHLIELIKELPLNTPFNYVNPKSQSTVTISSISASEGIVSIVRTTKDGVVKKSSINLSKLTIIAAGLIENIPISIDDLLRNNDNVRSAIEAVLVRTKEIYSFISDNHKTMIWVPSKPHKVGEICILSDSDYSSISSDVIQPLSDKLLNSTIDLVSLQISDTKKLLKILVEQTSKMESLLEREESLFRMLSKNK